MSVKDSNLMDFAGIHINLPRDPKSSPMTDNRSHNLRHHSTNIVGGVFTVLDCAESNQVYRFCDEHLAEAKVSLRTAMWMGEAILLVSLILLLHWYGLSLVQHFHRGNPNIYNHAIRYWVVNFSSLSNKLYDVLVEPCPGGIEREIGWRGNEIMNTIASKQ